MGTKASCTGREHQLINHELSAWWQLLACGHLQSRDRVPEEHMLGLAVIFTCINNDSDALAAIAHAAVSGPGHDPLLGLINVTAATWWQVRRKSVSLPICLLPVWKSSSDYPQGSPGTN